uniref:deleted in malignant brain tumors 1 protein-like n=1 Tax=Ciona intestinalis TaxID=7719 RepID=UPI0002B8E9F8|nr:deleted in malignant brain tumors 1 protein-like [Ciona intestinalis]|eukprot:XP_004225655.1 deleted in malignant brain tumors 1 protein-like [Ciona intestinalis]
MLGRKTQLLFLLCLTTLSQQTVAEENSNGIHHKPAQVVSDRHSPFANPKSISKVKACQGGESLSLFSGNFTSPNYPNYYDNKLYCTWLIQMPYQGYIVNLTVIDRQLQYSHDYLYLYDGPSTNSPLLAALTGAMYFPTTYYSSTSTMFVVLETDDYGQEKGFRVNYTNAYPQKTTAPTVVLTTAIPDKACNGGDYIYSPSGYISSPNYPENYADDLSCTWQIRIPNNYNVIKLSVSDFNVEDVFDFLNVYDGPSNNFPLIASWTGQYYSETVYSSSCDMFLLFHSDPVLARSGFKVYFESVSQIEASKRNKDK